MPKLMKYAKAILVAMSITLVMLGGVANAKDSAYRVIQNFKGSPDGWGPVGVPVAAKNGDLYGVTSGGGTSDSGTVFKLTAPQTRGGAWTETVLYNFTPEDAGHPTALVLGDDGTLYGAGSGPNPCGFIFRLTPPAGGSSWHYDVIYTVTHIEYGCAIQGITFGPDGNLYGAMEQSGSDGGYGTVFELKRPRKDGGKWVFNVLHFFTGGPDGAEPFAGVALYQKRNVYGTTAGGGTFGYGTAYRVSPPTQKGGNWTETVLYSFDPGTNTGASPSGPVMFDESGNMYGTTAFGGELNCLGGFGCGVVFELSPPKEKMGTWTYHNLYSFLGGSDGAIPTGYVVIDSKGNLYSSTEEGGGESDAGVAFKLSPPSQRGGAWTETVLHRFKAPVNEGDNGGLIWGKWNNLYGVTNGGGRYDGGTVFELQP